MSAKLYYYHFVQRNNKKANPYTF